MENLKVLLRLTAEKIREHETALEGGHRALGQLLLDDEPPPSLPGEQKELFARARETWELITSSQAASDRLTKLTAQLTELRSRIEEKSGELAVLREEIEPQYEKVGRAALDALAGEREEAAPYRKEIDQLTTLEDELRDINHEINRGGSREQERGIVTQALVGGRRLYLQGLSRTKALRAASLYRRLGKGVCDSDLIGRLDSRAFVTVLEPVLKNKEQASKIEAQISALENKAERLESDIASLAEGERPQRRQQRLESDRAKAREVLDLQLRDLGTRYADRPVEKSSMPNTVKERLEEVLKIRKALEQLAARRERLEAAISIEELERKVDAERARVRSLESTVRKANKEIESLNEEIKELNGEQQRLLAVRGPLEELTGATAEEE